MYPPPHKMTDQRRRAQAAMHEALEVICVKTGMSSAHVTFPPRPEWLALGERGYLCRTGIQYHWENRGYAVPVLVGLFCLYIRSL